MKDDNSNNLYYLLQAKLQREYELFKLREQYAAWVGSNMINPTMAQNVNLQQENNLSPLFPFFVPFNQNNYQAIPAPYYPVQVNNNIHLLQMFMPQNLNQNLYNSAPVENTSFNFSVNTEVNDKNTIELEKKAKKSTQPNKNISLTKSSINPHCSSLEHKKNIAGNVHQINLKKEIKKPLKQTCVIHPKSQSVENDTTSDSKINTCSKYIYS